MKQVLGLALFRGRTACMLLLATSLVLPALITADASAQTTEQACTTLEMSDGDCALLSAVATRGNSWIISRFDPVNSGAGANLRSPSGVAHDARACLDLAVNLPAGSRINFNWRTETEENSDYFAFYLNDSIFARNSGLVGWHLLSFVSPEPITRLSWCYERDSSGGDPDDHNGRIDRLQFNVQSIPWTQFCDALRISEADCAQVTSVRNAANNPWEPVTGAETFSGRAYQSDPDIGDGQQSVLTVTLARGVEGLEFYRRVSSEIGFDWLIFEYNDADRGPGSRSDQGSGLLSLEPYRNLPFFDGAGTGVQGDLSGFGAFFSYGDGLDDAGSDINSGANNQWSLLRLLPTDGNITELRWIYRKDGNDSEGSDRAWIDSLQLHPALTNRTQLCEALDLNEQSCSMVASFAEQPSNRLWTVDDGITPAPVGGSALRVPLRVPDGEKVCLSLSRPVAANNTVEFSWRLNAASNSMLTFEVNNTVQLTLTGDGSDSSWAVASWTATEAIDSFSWCYQGAEVTRAWVDDLKLLTLASTSAVCAVLDMTAADCAMVSALNQSPDTLRWDLDSALYRAGGNSLRSPTGVAHDTRACLDLAVNLPAGSRINFDWRTETEENSDYFAFYLNDSIVARNSGLIDWRLLSIVSPEPITRLGWCYERDSSGGDPDNHNGRIDRLQFNVQSNPWAEFCNTLRLSDGDCAQVISVRNAGDRPWEPVTGASTFSGRGYQSDPGLSRGRESVLSVTLRPGVAGLEFHRRVFSEVGFDWLIFEYDDTERGEVARSYGFGSLASYQSLPFFDGADTPVEGDLSGFTGTGDTYIYGSGTGANGEWLLLRLLPTDGDITELRWTYRSLSFGSDRGWIDSLRLHQGLTNNSQLCSALDLNEQSCSVVSSFAHQPSNRLWTVDEGVTPAPSGGTALRIPLRVLGGEKVCLSMSLVQPIAAGFTVVFSWRLNADSGSNLTFEVDGTVELMLAGDGSDSTWTTATWQVPEAVDSFAWCYEGTDISQAWVDDLELLRLNTTSAVCAVLDMTAADCAVLGALNQSPDRLQWDADSAIHRAGGNSLRSPQTVADGETACLTLTLEPPLPASTGVTFWWRVDSAARSALELRFNGAALTPLDTISGLASGVTSNNGWRMHTSEAAAELTSLGWCYSRVAGQFAGTEQGWIEQLRLNPPFVFPVFTAGEVTRLANNDIRFDLQLRPGSREAVLPADVVVRMRQYNLENVILTTLTASATALNYRVTATVLNTNDIARLGFTVGPLPPGVDPLPESAEFTVTIESQAVVGVAMVLGALGAAPNAEPQGISLNDLLVALRLTANEDVTTLLANLGLNNGDRMEEMERFNVLITDPDQSGPVDVNNDDAVDTLDFRLMVRYLSGLRGEELLCSSLCEAELRSLLEP